MIFFLSEEREMENENERQEQHREVLSVIVGIILHFLKNRRSESQNE